MTTESKVVYGVVGLVLMAAALIAQPEGGPMWRKVLSAWLFGVSYHYWMLAKPW